MSESIKRKRLSTRHPVSSPIDSSDIEAINTTIHEDSSNRRRTLGNRVVLGNIDTNTSVNRISLGRASISNKSNLISSKSSHPILDVAALSSLYSVCIKLASTNKITQKNTWGLHLIDHMNDVIQRDVNVASDELDSINDNKYSNNDELTNFQKASATLDASMMIYSHRVDYVHTQTYKVLGGLSNNSNITVDDDDTMVSDNVDGTAGGGVSTDSPAKKKKLRKGGGATIETKLHNINLKDNEYDVVCPIDPLVHKYTALFDDGRVSGMLLNNISVYNNVCLVFDSSVVINQVDEDDEQNMNILNNCGFDRNEMKSLFTSNIALDRLNDIEICYDMQKFRTMKQCLEQGIEYKPNDTESIIPVQPQQSSDADSDSDEYGIGLSDIVLPSRQSMNDGDDGTNAMDDVLNREHELYSNDHDDIDDTSNNDDQYSNDNSTLTQSVPVRPSAPAQLSLLQQLGIDIGDSDDIFSNNVSNWAGVSHWRYNKPHIPLVKQSNKPKQKKQPVVLDFFDLTVPDNKLFSIPTRSTITLPERTADELESDIQANKLPIDIQYKAKQLQQLFLKPTVLVRLPGKKSIHRNNDSNAMMSSDQVIASTQYTAPQVIINDTQAADTLYNQVDAESMIDDNVADNEQLAFGDENDVNVGTVENGGDNDLIDQDANNDEYIGDDHLGDLLTVDDNENISLIEKPQQAEKLNIEYARVAKRVDVKLLKHNIWQQLHTIKPIEQNTTDKILSFQSSVNKLNTMYNDTTLAPLSIPYCFICVLHLANEHSLILQHQSDDPLNSKYLGDLNVIIPNTVTINSVGHH